MNPRFPRGVFFWLVLLMFLAGCDGSNSSGPGSASGTMSITSTVDFHSECSSDSCSVTAELTGSYGEDDAVHIAFYDSENHTIVKRVHSFWTPVTSIGDSIVVSAPTGPPL